jgi:hypothetical protein
MVSASGSGLMPICPPSGPMSRTSLARILSLIRGSVLLLVAGDAAIADHSSCVALVLLRKFDTVSKKRSTGAGEADARAGRDTQVAPHEPRPGRTPQTRERTTTVAGRGLGPAFRLRSSA